MYCQEHPQSPGVGVCVACQTVVCASCTTRLQGRNFCAVCLKRRAGPAAESIPAQSGSGLRFLVGVLGFTATLSLLSIVALAGFFLHRMG